MHFLIAKQNLPTMGLKSTCYVGLPVAPHTKVQLQQDESFYKHLKTSQTFFSSSVDSPGQQWMWFSSFSCYYHVCTISGGFEGDSFAYPSTCSSYKKSFTRKLPENRENNTFLVKLQSRIKKKTF